MAETVITRARNRETKLSKTELQNKTGRHTNKTQNHTEDCPDGCNVMRTGAAVEERKSAGAAQDTSSN